jgi:L-asparaginase type II
MKTSRLIPVITVFLLSTFHAISFGQESPNPIIKIVATGGTIANTLDGRIPIQDVIGDIRENFPETQALLDSVDFEVIDLIRVSSHDFIGENFLQIARTVNEVIQEPNIKGVIVTQGTTTSEITAYFLHLLVRSSKPVVVVNSQRRHGTVGNDGDKNFIDAVSVILSPDAAGKGALVVTNQTINSGREVLKTSARPDAFVSGEHGILGIIEEDRVDFYRMPTRKHTLRSEFDINTITELPKVEIINAYFDADAALIRAAAASGARGIVIDGMTPRGHPHASQRPALEDLVDQGIIVVSTTRGGVNNRIPLGSQEKFIEGDNLVAQKARVLLQLALTRTSDPGEIQRIFNEY